MAQSTSEARPKRAGDDFARAYEQTTKKPRFDYRNPSTLAADAPEEDVILDADVIGKGGRQIKRNAVNIDGYESDSDNDNFNARAAERERNKSGDANGPRSKDEEDDDMFADLEEQAQGTASGDEDEDVTREGKRMKKKDVKFLDPADIEGQVMNSTSGGHVSGDILLHPREGKKRAQQHQSDDSDSSGEDEDRDLLPEEMEDELAAEVGAGGKKRHAPRLNAFNLKDEEEEGRFDEAGNYVRKAADPDALNDSWLESLSKKDMKRAREAQEKRDSEQSRKAAETDALLTSDLLSTLIQFLETGETPLEALQRLNKGKLGEKKVPKWKLKKARNGMDVDDNESDAAALSLEPIERGRRKALEVITGAADALYSREHHDIYDTEREKLMRQYRRETGDDWEAPGGKGVSGEAGGADQGAAWEYRWSDARDGGEQHGPYDGATMKAWNDAGYFGVGVEFRRVGGSEWNRILDVK